MKARLHPHWIGGRTGYVYSVIYEGQLLVDRLATLSVTLPGL